MTKKQFWQFVNAKSISGRGKSISLNAKVVFANAKSLFRWSGTISRSEAQLTGSFGMRS